MMSLKTTTLLVLLAASTTTSILWLSRPSFSTSSSSSSSSSSSASTTTDPPAFFLLDPLHYRPYFPDEASFEVAKQVAPFVDLPNRDIATAYYYRLRSYRKHLKKTADDKYWIVTEFLPDVPWAGPSNTISAAAGHHILEGRWFWDAPLFLEEYIRFWYLGNAGKAQTHIKRYTEWIYSAAWQYSLLWDNQSVVQDTHESAAEVFRTIYVDKYLTNGSHHSKEGWERLCWVQDDGFDAMEVSVSGGGCRPTIASALWGQATALVNVGETLGKDTQEFQQWASFSQQVITQQHWNPAIDSFAVIPPPKPSHYSIQQMEKNPPHCDLNQIRIPNQTVQVRELLAFMPWYFSNLLPTDNSTQLALWAKQFRWLLDSTGDNGLTGPWGLRTVQRNTPCYNYSWDHGDCWNGPSWPFETSRVLTAIANLLLDHDKATIQASGMDSKVFEKLLIQYARQHTATRAINDTARPLHSGHVFENVHPDQGYWNNRERMYWRNATDRNMGDDYNHSTFIDLILNGWLGIRLGNEEWLVVDPIIQAPHWAVDRVPYKGRNLAILFDIDGTHYNRGKGMRIFIDGQLVGHREDQGRLVIQEEPPKSIVGGVDGTRATAEFRS